jgi:RND family efflux transporter MFP subunit
LKLAQSRQDRLVGLRQSKAVSDQELDEAVYGCQAAVAQLAVVNARLNELVNGTRPETVAAHRAELQRLLAEREAVEIQINKSQLLAPYDGMLTSRLLDEGVVVTAGEPVFQMMDHRRIEARIGFPVDAIDAVTRLDQHLLSYRSSSLSARLKSVRPEKNPDTRTVDVLFALPEMSPPPSIGDVVSLELETEREAVGCWIPAQALIESYRGLWACYVAEMAKNNGNRSVARLRELQVLHREQGLCYVQGALNPGELIIVSGVHRIVAGQSVQVSNPGREHADRAINGRPSEKVRPGASESPGAAFSGGTSNP